LPKPDEVDGRRSPVSGARRRYIGVGESVRTLRSGAKPPVTPANSPLRPGSLHSQLRIVDPRETTIHLFRCGSIPVVLAIAAAEGGTENDDGRRSPLSDALSSLLAGSAGPAGERCGGVDYSATLLTPSSRAGPKRHRGCLRTRRIGFGSSLHPSQDDQLTREVGAFTTSHRQFTTARLFTVGC
jgi:hypothetical protein